jgi:hypothetical protein
MRKLYTQAACFFPHKSLDVLRKIVKYLTLDISLDKKAVRSLEQGS